jgi:hypothetical protein
MKKFVNNNDNSVYANLISIFVIFFTFTVLSLVLILITTDSYKKMKNEIDNTFNSSALIGYISNKIKSYDSNDNKIRIIEVDGENNILQLENNAEKLVTYIYEKNDIVYEAVVRKGDKLNSKLGQELFKAKEIEFKIYESHLIKVNVKTVNDEEISNFINIKTGALK